MNPTVNNLYLVRLRYVIGIIIVVNGRRRSVVVSRERRDDDATCARTFFPVEHDDKPRDVSVGSS